tara:strand:- start:1703 stop:3571 length:1869 start_codon:yes stop_codon:yes gene_type:complete
MQRKVNAGVIDPAKLAARQKRVLAQYIHSKQLPADTKIVAGNYCFICHAGEERATEYNFELIRSFIFRGVINPAETNSQHQSAKDFFFSKARREIYVPAGFYQLPSNHANPQLYVELHLLVFGIAVRHKFKDILCYDLIDQLDGAIGEGAFGRVFNLHGSVKPKYSIFGGLAFSPGKNKRVVKLQVVSSGQGDHYHSMWRSEYSLMKRVGYLSPRDLKCLGERERLCYLSMRKIQGTSLSDILDNDKNKVRELTVRDRLALSIGLIQVLSTHFQENNILHRDIKPDNIIVDKAANRPFWDVRVIDLGLSIDTSSPSHNAAGAPLFVAPEIYGIHCKNTEATDIYSLARVVGLIWRDKQLSSYDGISYSEFVSRRKNESKVNFDMFDGIEVGENIKAHISGMLRQMTSAQQFIRPDYRASLEAFENIRHLYYLSLKGHSVYRFNMSEVFRSVSNLNSFIYRECRSSQKVALSLGTFRSEIISAISNIADTPYTIDYFIEVLGVSCLRDSTNRAEMLATVSGAFLDYTDATEDWWHALDLLQSVYKDMIDNKIASDPLGKYHLKRYLQFSEKFMDKIAVVTYDLDDLIERTQQIRKKITGMNEITSKFSSVKLENTDLSRCLNK